MMTIFTFILAHKAALAIAGSWGVRELHNAWPFLQENGGYTGVWRKLKFGNAVPAPDPKTQTEQNQGTK